MLSVLYRVVGMKMCSTLTTHAQNVRPFPLHIAPYILLLFYAYKYVHNAPPGCDVSSGVHACMSSLVCNTSENKYFHFAVHPRTVSDLFTVCEILHLRGRAGACAFNLIPHELCVRFLMWMGVLRVYFGLCGAWKHIRHIFTRIMITCNMYYFVYYLYVDEKHRITYENIVPFVSGPRAMREQLHFNAVVFFVFSRCSLRGILI